jgi:hypothetical protein
LAWLESTSIDCARVMRGISSIAKVTMPVPANARRALSLPNGSMIAMTSAPGL